MRKLQTAITGTAGDSFLLAASPVSRAMMVGQLKRDALWLAGQCDQLFIVAHSQGCAVSYLALCEALPAELRKVTWIGSGLRKLEILRAAERRPGSVLAGWAVAVLPLTVWFLVVRPSLGWTWEVGVTNLLVALACVGSYIVGLMTLIWGLRVGATSLWLRLWADLNVGLTEIFASHDPVPNGPLFDDNPSEYLKVDTREVRNRASLVSDHTAYWGNIEEVVLPLGLEIAKAIGLPVDHLLHSDDQRLKGGIKRRHHRVNSLIALRCVVFAGGAWLVQANWSHWTDLAVIAANQASGFVSDFAVQVREFKAPFQMLLVDLAVMLGSFISVTIAWRLWDLHEQQALLMRDQPNKAAVGLLTWVMVACASAPSVSASSAVFGPTGTGIAIALLSVVPLLFAFLSMANTKTAFDPAQTPKQT
jgi:hypothetical protein